VVEEREGKNVCTHVGKEMLAQAIVLSALGGTRLRSDAIAYIGLGTGNQPQVPSLRSLNSPVAYLPGEYLAPLDLPTSETIEGDALSVAMVFSRTWVRGEISLGQTVRISEAGLFSNGDPRNGWSVPGPTDLTTAAAFVPMFYKAFEPIPVGVDDDVFTVRWEVRVL
jgi:hypothetical protein